MNSQSIRHKWTVRVKDKINDYCKKLAFNIEQKGLTNISKAITLTSNTEYYASSTSTKESSKTAIVYEVVFEGKQLAFLEFGTGIHNEPFMAKVGGYIPDIVNSGIPPRASYGKGYGKNEIWVFTKKSNVSSDNGDVEYTYRVYHRKKDGGTSYYPLKTPAVATKGLKPQRMIYNAIKDSIAEVNKK